MENNIFEGAEFGDKFVCKDNEIALFTRHDSLYDSEGNFLKNIVWLYTISNGETSYSLDGFYVDDNGFCDKTDYGFIIVSRYQEPIDENKLDELANEWCKQNADISEDGWVEFDGHEAYKAGYRKAKEG